jgi:hypothetical protein
LAVIIFVYCIYKSIIDTNIRIANSLFFYCRVQVLISMLKIMCFRVARYGT